MARDRDFMREDVQPVGVEDGHGDLICPVYRTGAAGNLLVAVVPYETLKRAEPSLCR